MTTQPWAIRTEGNKSRSSQNSLFRNSLQKLAPLKPLKSTPNDVQCCIVDAMRVLRIISTSGLKPPTFLTWAKAVCDYFNSLPGSYIHVIFDIYLVDDDFAYPSKDREELGQKRHVSSLSQNLPSPKDWSDFLTNKFNKFQVISLLVDFILSVNFKSEKDIIINCGSEYYLKTTEMIISQIPELTSSHREADPRLAFHAVYASSRLSNGSVCVVSDDTDVYILLLFVCSMASTNIYFRQGTNKKGIEYHNVTSLGELLGDKVCSVLPCLHALTVTDFMYPFFRRTKFQTFKRMLEKQSTKYLISLKTENVNIAAVIDFILHTVYNRPKKEKTPGRGGSK